MTCARLVLVSCVLIPGAAPAACHSAPPPPVSGEVLLVDAYPGLPDFRRPLLHLPVPRAAATEAEQQPSLEVVVEQGGKVHVLSVSGGKVVDERWLLVDLTGRVSRRGNEEGLLGLAFHPGFAENGRLFLHYSVSGKKKGRVVEMTVLDPAHPVAEPGSERVLLEVRQPWRNHNGGHLEFGPDGFLYAVFGDGGSAGDPRNNAQDRSNLLGTILRLDVDGPHSEGAYSIPPDNPFVGQEGVRPEIWAFGLRNAWRFSFDPEGGALWAGDVGQIAREEIDVVVKGGNYGWPHREGMIAYDTKRPRGPGAFLDPVVDYPRKDGLSVTGGYVYRGADVPALEGRYVYADYGTGNVWAIPSDASGSGKRIRPVLLAVCERPASFGLDRRGEILVCCFDGRIRRFASSPG